MWSMILGDHKKAVVKKKKPQKNQHTWMAFEELPWTRWRKSGGKMLSSIRFS